MAYFPVNTHGIDLFSGAYHSKLNVSMVSRD